MNNLLHQASQEELSTGVLLCLPRPPSGLSPLPHPRITSPFSQPSPLLVPFPVSQPVFIQSICVYLNPGTHPPKRPTQHSFSKGCLCWGHWSRPTRDGGRSKVRDGDRERVRDPNWPLGPRATHFTSLHLRIFFSFRSRWVYRPNSIT